MIRYLGGVGSDGLTGGAGADLIDGGNGADILIYSAVADSTGALYDTLNGVDSDEDHIDTAASISAVDAWVKTGAPLDGLVRHRPCSQQSTRRHWGRTMLSCSPPTRVRSRGTHSWSSTATVWRVYQAGLDLVMELTNGAHLKALAASDLHLIALKEFPTMKHFILSARLPDFRPGGPVIQDTFTGDGGDNTLVGTSGRRHHERVRWQRHTDRRRRQRRAGRRRRQRHREFRGPDRRRDGESTLAGTATTASGTSTLTSIENLTGGAGDDFLTGGSGANCPDRRRR
jgi:hypothetical protein